MLSSITMRTVIFDLDHTIINLDSFAGFIVFLLKRHPLRLIAAGLVAPVMMPLLRRRKTITRAFSAFLWIATIGLADADFRRFVDEYVEYLATHRQGTVYRDALTKLAEHRNAGDRVIIITGAAVDLAHPLCKRLGIRADLILGSALKRWHGGLVAEFHCFGHRKLQRLATLGILPPWDIVYTDSSADIPILAGSRERFIVNPSPRARQRIHKALGPDVTELHWG